MFNPFGHALAATLILADAKRPTRFGFLGAFAPANWSDTCAMLTGWVAKFAELDQVLVASHLFLSWRSRVLALGTTSTDVCHARRAIRRANTASNGVEGFHALGVVEGAQLFRTFELVHLTSSTPISVRLVAVIARIVESVRALLPANRSIMAVVSVHAGWIAEISMPLHAIRAVTLRFTE